MLHNIKNLQKFWEFGNGHTVLAAFFAHSVSLSIGLTQGYSAILIPQILSNEEYSLSFEEISWIASFGAITNPIGSVLSGLVAEYFGRKSAIQLSCLPFLLGWLCIGLAQDVNWIYTGRLITGIAAGMSTACFTYVSEISTPESRGYLQSLSPINASFGILLSYTLGYFLHWTNVAFISIIFAVFTLIGIQFVPESPAYLAKINKCQESFDSYLFFMRNNALAQEELNKYSCCKTKTLALQKSFRQRYLTQENLKPFAILVVLFMLQELSGIYTILFYTVNIFQETNLEINEFISSIVLGLVRFSMAILVAFLVNKFGRKQLCMTSALGMAISIFPLIFYPKFAPQLSDIPLINYFPLVSIILNVAFSMIGLLPIPYVLVGEFFPLEVRSIMSGLTICIAQIFIFICVKVYPNLMSVLGFDGTLLTFFVASIMAFIFCKFYLPETKSKSLEEIEEYFKNGNRSSICDELSKCSDDPNRGVFVVKIEQ